MQHTTSKFDESLPTTEKLDYGNGAARRTPVVKRVASKFWHWRWRNITVYLCVAALLAIIGIAAWLAYRAEANNADFTQIIDEGQEVDGLVMYGRVISIDLAALSVAISWSLFGSGTFTSPDKALFSEDGVLLGLAMETVNVFMNGTANIAGTYQSSINIDQYFTTRHFIKPAQYSEKFSAVASSIRYPLDTYEIGAIFGSMLPDNTTVPVVSANLFSNVQGWSIKSTDVRSPYSGVNFAYADGRSLQMTISRSPATIAYVVGVMIVMWVVAGLMLYFACLVLFGVQLIPNFLFALPALRNTMPLVPPFGTYIDIFGLLMQLMVTGLSFVVLTVVYIHKARMPQFKHA